MYFYTVKNLRVNMLFNMDVYEYYLKFVFVIGIFLYIDKVV